MFPFESRAYAPLSTNSDADEAAASNTAPKGHHRWKSHNYPFTLVVSPASPSTPSSSPTTTMSFEPAPLPAPNTARRCPFPSRRGLSFVRGWRSTALIVALALVLVVIKVELELGGSFRQAAVDRADAVRDRLLQGWFASSEVGRVAQENNSDKGEIPTATITEVESDSDPEYKRPTGVDGLPVSLEDVSSQPIDSPTSNALKMIVPDPPDLLRPASKQKQPQQPSPPKAIVTSDATALRESRERFLVPATLGEQETKASLHIHQLGLLARSLNRTLVLPNTQHGRFALCHSHPFSFLYQPNTLDTLGVQTATSAAFLDFVGQSPVPPTAQIVRLTIGGDRPGRVLPDSDEFHHPHFLKHEAPCLAREAFDWRRRLPLKINKPRGHIRPAAKLDVFGTRVVEDLREAERRSGETDVLLVDYFWIEEMMDHTTANKLSPELPPAPPFRHLEYAQPWADLAQSVSDGMGPYIAVHWRMETMSPDALPPCGSALVSKLLAMQRAHPSIRTVYFLTDYPIDSISEEMELTEESTKKMAANSGTFTHRLYLGHHLAMQGFLREFRERASATLELTTLRTQLARTSILPHSVEIQLEAVQVSAKSRKAGRVLDELDPSLVGVVAKMVAARAELFVASNWNDELRHCGRISSFAQNIVALRKEEFDKQTQKGAKGKAKGKAGTEEEGTLWNVGEEWRRTGD